MHALPRSRAVAEVGYDAGSQTLRVHFREGRRYDYFNVAPSVFAGLLGSAHPWTEWGSRVKSHRYRRLDQRSTR